MRESPSSGDTWAKYERLSGKSPDLGVKQGLWKDFSGRGSIMCSGMEVWRTTALLEKSRSTCEEPGICGVKDRREPFRVLQVHQWPPTLQEHQRWSLRKQRREDPWSCHTQVWAMQEEPHWVRPAFWLELYFYSHLRFERTWHAGPGLLSASLLCPNPLGSTFILCQYLLQVTSFIRSSSVMWSSSSYLPQNYLI